MKKRALKRCLILAALLGTLGACGGDDPPPPQAPQIVLPPPPPPPEPPKPPEPTVASLTLKAGPNVNPSTSSQPSPVVVRVYQLTNVTAFQETDFFQLQQDASSALGDELVNSEDFVLAPGQMLLYQRKLPDDVRFLGVTAAFRDLSGSSWRSYHAVPAAKTSLLEAELAGTQISMRKAGL
ncbi:MAG: type VI secretion system lipoprotein TssJ [Geminicoccaceae bacterium]